VPEFISRKGNTFARFSSLALFIDRELDAALNGEVVCFDREGRPRFYELMFGRGDPTFVAFDVLVLADGLRFCKANLTCNTALSWRSVSGPAC
jgi:ATP-dependent DNA ligase